MFVGGKFRLLVPFPQSLVQLCWVSLRHLKLLFDHFVKASGLSCYKIEEVAQHIASRCHILANIWWQYMFPSFLYSLSPLRHELSDLDQNWACHISILYSISAGAHHPTNALFNKTGAIDISRYVFATLSSYMYLFRYLFCSTFPFRILITNKSQH